MSDQSTYLRFLPAVYSSAKPAIIAHYLKIFEKILSGIDDTALGGRRGIHELLAADVIGNLFYPRLSFLFPANENSFIPPISDAPVEKKKELLAALNAYLGVPPARDPLAPYLAQPPNMPDPDQAITSWLDEFLTWLGGWVGLVVDKGWGIDKKRQVVAEIMALYRMRGTLQGLSMLTNLLLDLPLPIIGQKLDAKGKFEPVAGFVSVAFGTPAAPDIMVSGAPATAFILRDSHDAGAPVLSGYLPWLFTGQIALPNLNDPSFLLTLENVEQVMTLYRQLEQLLQSIKPAASSVAVTIIPSMQLQSSGNAAVLGVNTLLGEQGIST